MKSKKSLMTIAAALTLTALTSSALAAQGPMAYVCAGNPNNMIGLAPQYTLLFNQTGSPKVIYSQKSVDLEIEESRSHNNDPLQMTVQGSVYEISGNIYSSETAAAVGTLTLSLDIQKLTLTYKGDYNVVLPCKRK